jgi:hypothetical protein
MAIACNPDCIDQFRMTFQRANEVLQDHQARFEPKDRALQSLVKEVVGIRVLLIRSLFGGGIPRRLLLRVSLAKPTSAPLRF